MHRRPLAVALFALALAPVLPRANGSASVAPTAAATPARAADLAARRKALAEDRIDAWIAARVGGGAGPASRDRPLKP